MLIVGGTEAFVKGLLKHAERGGRIMQTPHENGTSHRDKRTDGPSFGMNYGEETISTINYFEQFTLIMSAL